MTASANTVAALIKKAPGPTADIVKILQETPRPMSSYSYLPVGSEEATKWYVEQAIEAGCAFVNGIPVFIAPQNTGANALKMRVCPSSATTSNRRSARPFSTASLTRLFRDRGVRIDRTYQLNFGGNTDFLNMLERERLESKKISKTNAVTSMLEYDIGPDNVHVGPSDYVPWLLDRKWAYIRLEGTTFGDVPLNMELKLEVWDSPQLGGRHD